MNNEEQARFIYRNLVYALYDEISALTPQIHAGVASSADMKNSFFQREHEKQAAQLYLQTEMENDLDAIDQPYRERTGLSLEDVQRAFAEGKWQNRYGAYSSGGPRWAEIGRVTLALRDAISRQEWEEAAGLVAAVKRMKYNQGLLIERFERIERYRPR